MTVLLIAIGAAVGAPTRFLIDRVIRERWGDGFPWGTLLVNVAGSFLLGLVLATSASSGVVALVGTGFCGALATYSTFSFETLRLIEDGAGVSATLNVVLSIAVGCAAAAVGWSLGNA